MLQKPTHVYTHYVQPVRDKRHVFTPVTEEAVNGHRPAETLIVLSHSKAYFLLHRHAILGSSGFYEWPVKEVAVVCDVDPWLDLHCMQSRQIDIEFGITANDIKHIVIVWLVSVLSLYGLSLYGLFQPCGHFDLSVALYARRNK